MCNDKKGTFLTSLMRALSEIAEYKVEYYVKLCYNMGVVRMNCVLEHSCLKLCSFYKRGGCLYEHDC